MEGYDLKADATLPSVVVPPTARRKTRGMSIFSMLAYLLAGLYIIYSVQYKRTTRPAVERELHRAEPDFDWLSLTPSEDINWTPCFSEYKCARIILPLDYLSPPGVGPNVTIALQLLPAADKENYRGTILINPGGPGGAGTDLIKRRGKDIARISGGSYDVLGFDPRGTGASTPSAQCFDSQSQLDIWGIQAGAQLLNLTDGSVGMARARERVVGQMCEKALGGNGREDLNGTVEEWGAGRFMSTASVATDMLKITEKLGEEKLKYWGFSYGSVLGQYFAAMYPDKVGRLIIDGVYDAYNYRATLWNTNLVDTDAVWASFHNFCYEAGPEQCPLYESSPADVQDRVTAIINGLTADPRAIPFAPGGPLVLTKKTLHNFAFRAAYSPVINYPPLADILLAVEQDNQTALAAAAPKLGGGVQCKCEQSLPWLMDTEAFYAIACGDGDPITYSDEDYAEWFSHLSETSEFAAPIWGFEYLRCSEWRIRPKWRYMGPLAAEKTANPVLIVSPTYDTVCPLTDARAVHARYAGSGLLVQNSYGHCSLAAPSLCTAKHIRAYYENGTIPEEGTVCEVDELPFIGQVGGEKIAAMSVEDRELLESLRAMAEEVPTFGHF